MVIAGRNSVMVKCKKCGQEAPADSFKLDYEYKTVVCQNCYLRKSRPLATGVKNTPIGDSTPGFKSSSKIYEERASKNKESSMTYDPRVKNVATTVINDDIKVKKDSNAGWDKEDDFLELEMLKKREDENRFKPTTRLRSEVVGPDIMMVKCYFCSYNFKYNTLKQTPRLCPNCAREVDQSLY